MAVVSERIIGINFTGDIDAPNLAFNAAENTNAPGEIDVVALSTGANTIAVPSNAKGVTIIPIAGNTTALTLKGVSGDTGIALHLTDPSSFGINPATTTSFVIAASTTGPATSCRIIWS